MAGTLEIGEELCWMPAGWVYDNALEAMASCIDNTELAGTLLASRVDVNGGYLDLRGWGVESISALRDAAKKASTEFETRGADGFAMPEYYDGFVKHLRALVAMLESRAVELRVG